MTYPTLRLVNALGAIAVPLSWLAIVSGCDRMLASASHDGQPGLRFGNVRLSQYCERSAEAECYRMLTCRPVRLTSMYGGYSACTSSISMTCEREFTEVQASVLEDLGLVRVDPYVLGRILEEHTLRSCASTVPVPSLLAASSGLVDLGDACATDGVCRSQKCTRTSGRCGVCAPREGTQECPPACPVDKPCTCLDGATGKRCRCGPLLGAGADCRDDPRACQEGLVCIEARSDDGTVSSRCRPIPAAGQPCGIGTGFTECLGDAYCNAGSGPLGMCERPIVVKAGEGCDDRTRLCPINHDCRGVCVKRADVGQTCVPINAQNIPDGGPPTCLTGVCLQVCADPQDEGGLCSRVFDCRDPLGCTLSPFQGLGICRREASVRDDVKANVSCLR